MGVNRDDLKIDYIRIAGGAKTVRVIHLPTGIVELDDNADTAIQHIEDRLPNNSDLSTWEGEGGSYT